MEQGEGVDVATRPTMWEKLKEFMGEMYKDLQSATRKDKIIDDTLEKAGGNVVTKSYANRKKWAVKYWWVFLVGFLLILGISEATKPVKKSQRSHHKYDKNGRLIY